MTTPPTLPTTEPAASTTRVAALVRRAQWRVAAFSLVCVSLLLAIASGVALREYELRAMELAARSLALAGEPAMRFNDRAAMLELIEQLAPPTQLAEVTITDGHARPWLKFDRPASGTAAAWARRLERALVDAPASAQIGLDAKPLGRIALRSDGSALMRYALWALASIALCVGATTFVVLRHSRRLADAIVMPISELARLTRQVRESRSFERRAARTVVAEVDGLADDFNAMLQELQAQQALIEERHADLERANGSLWTLSRHDALTGLPNRAYLRERLDEVIEHGRRARQRAGLVFIDADRFKATNDQHGHAAGDALLVELAARLRTSVRESDFIARLGGDEFVVVLTPLHGTVEITTLVERIRAAMGRPVELGRSVWLPAIGVSMGVAVFPDHADTLDGLVRAADDAMYRAKSTARGRVVAFRPIDGLPALVQLPPDAA